MGVKFGLLLWRKDTDWACLITKSWWEYFDLRKMYKGRNYIMKSFIICTCQLNISMVIKPRKMSWTEQSVRMKHMTDSEQLRWKKSEGKAREA